MTQATPAGQSETLRFFQREEERLRRGLTTSAAPFGVQETWIAAAVLALVVPGLLYVLESSVGVIAYINVLLAAAFYGLWQIRSTEKATAHALKHTAELEQRRMGGASRRQLVAHLEERTSADDQSHAAEAIRSFLIGRAGSEAVPLAARSAFSETENLAEATSFMRGALILGGLFGTVLFFALELTQLSTQTMGLSQQNQIIQGLRGALASTLTGILGALALGILASRLQQRINKIIQETETFLGGALLPLIQKESGTTAPGTEVELWEALRAEVAQLSIRIDERTEDMADDAEAYARSLEEVSKRLGELPQVRVPPELANLEEVVAQFSHGSTLLHETSHDLVEAVGAMGIFAPARLLGDLENLRGEIGLWRTESKEALGAASKKIEEAGAQLRADGREVAESTAAAIEKRLAVLDQAAKRLDESVPQLERLFEEGRKSLRSVEGSVTESGHALKEVGKELKHVPQQIQIVLTEIQEEIRALQKSATEPESAPAAIPPARDSAGSTGDPQHDLHMQEILRRLREMEGLIEWHRTASQGVLWKILGMPLLPKGRLPFMPRQS